MKARKSVLFLTLLCTVGLTACNNAGNSSSVSSKVSTSSTSASSTIISSSTSTSIDEQYDKVADVREYFGEGELATIKGVVVKHNYTGQGTPYITGFWVADKTGCIYVYGEEIAKSVEVGNTVVVKGAKAYYIPDTDSGSAAATNYKGMLQLTYGTILENDGKTTGLPHSDAITTTTVAEINKIPLTTDITGNIYKVKGRWSKVTPGDYTNYYLTDLNREDQIMAYTQSNGKDYAWTDENDGKTVEMLIIVSLGKPGVGKWRMCPISFLDTEVVVSAQEEAQYAVGRLLNEFADTYNTDTEVTFAVEDEYLAGSTRSITSTSEQITVTTGEVENTVVISASNLGKITLEASVTFDGVTATGTKEIEIVEKPKVETDTIAEARTMADGEVVTLEAVVAKVTYKSSMTPQGLFLTDETGSMFAYFGSSEQAAIADIQDGNKVIIKGTLTHYIKNAENATAENYAGDFQLTEPEIIDVNTNVNEIPTTSYTESTITEIVGTAPSTNITGLIYKVSAKVVKNETQWATSYDLVEVDGGTVYLPLYSQNSGKDFAWLDAYANTEVTVLVGVQNLNLKSSGSYWRGCPIQIIAE